MLPPKVVQYDSLHFRFHCRTGTGSGIRDSKIEDSLLLDSPMGVLFLNFYLLTVDLEFQ